MGLQHLVADFYSGTIKIENRVSIPVLQQKKTLGGIPENHPMKAGAEGI